MTESNELATVDLKNLGDLGIDFVSEKASTDIASVMTATSFLPRLQINGATTELVQTGKMRVGTLGLVWNKDSFRELGKEIVALSVSLRTKALMMPGAMTASGAKSTNENPIAYYDRDSVEFKLVQVEALKGGLNGNMFGPEFLLWIPEANTFATLYCSSDTLRRAAPAIVQEMKGDRPKLGPAPIRIKAKFIEGKKNKWWGLDFLSCSDPLPSPTSETWRDDLIAQVTKFKNPPKNEVEQAAEPAATSGDRVR